MSLPNTSWTIPKLKEFAKKNDIKIDSSWRKKELLEYILAYLSSPPPKITHKTIRYNSITSKSTISENPKEHLQRYGWAIVSLKDFDIEKYVSMYWDYLESYDLGLHRSDETTWKSENLPYMLHGIIKNYMGHSKMQWKVRENCLTIFQEIYESRDLVCSFDGGSFMLPNKELLDSSSTFTEWFHTDQGRYDNYTIQGLVTLSDNRDDVGGLIVLEESHLIYDDLIKAHPTYGYSFTRVSLDDPLFKNLQMVKLSAPPGHIILWDSRTIHCNAPTSNLRMCLYVSMIPREYCDKKILAKRTKLYETGKMTGHACTGLMFKIENDYKFGKVIPKPKEIEIALLNDVQRKLVGYN